MEKYNIHFEGPISSQDSPRWPKYCRKIFDDIRQLSRTEYAQYQVIPGDDPLENPWREQAKRRARHLVELAKRCLRDRKNENGWRLYLEPVVMKRLVEELNWFVFTRPPK